MSEELTGSRYNELMRSSCLDHDPWSRPNLQTSRPRHLKMYEAIETYLKSPRNSIADIGCHSGFFLRLVSCLANIWSEREGLKLAKRRFPCEKSGERSVRIATESYETRH
jgi:hypothetical protein